MNQVKNGVLRSLLVFEDQTYAQSRTHVRKGLPVPVKDQITVDFSSQKLV